MRELPLIRLLISLLCSLSLTKVLAPVDDSAFAAPIAAGSGKTAFASRESSFSSLVDQDDPTSQALLLQLEKLVAQIEKRASILSQNQALDQGLLNNPDLASAFYDIQGSEWDLIAARRSWYPALKASSNTQTLSGQPDILIGKNYVSTSTNPTDATIVQLGSVAPGLILSWSFFDPTRRPAINQALSSVFAQRFLFDISARDLVLNLQVAYTNVQAESELAQRYLWLFGVTRQQVLAAERMVRKGRMTRSSLDQLHTEQRLQLSRLIDRYQQLFTASNALAALVAVPPGRMVLASSPLVLQKSWQQDLDSTIQQALAMREEIKQKLSLADRDRWAAIRAINGYLPAFGLTAGGAYEESQGLSNSSQTSTTNIGLSFQWFLFDGGIKAADSTRLRSQSAGQLSAAARQRLLVTKEVMDAYNVYRTSELALQNTGTDFALSKKSVEDAVNLFAAKRDVTTLVQVFNLYISAADRDVGSKRQFNTAIYGLYRYSALWPEGLSQTVAQRRAGP
jgi:outer membrane protein TolC